MNLRCIHVLASMYLSVLAERATLNLSLYADRQIQDKDMMLMDMGCEYYAYDRHASCLPDLVKKMPYFTCRTIRSFWLACCH